MFSSVDSNKPQQLNQDHCENNNNNNNSSKPMNTSQRMSGAIRPQSDEDPVHFDSPLDRHKFVPDSFFKIPPPSVVFPGSAEDVSSEIIARYCMKKTRHFAGFKRSSDINNCANNNNGDAENAKGQNIFNLSADEVLARLDTVDKDIVGAAKVESLVANAQQWVKDNLKIMDPKTGLAALEMCTDEEYEEKCKKKGVPKRFELQKNMTKIMEHMVEIGMLERMDKANFDKMMKQGPVARAVMFMVEKLGAEIEIDGEMKLKFRIITDARDGNNRTKNNLTYLIFTLDALFQCVSNVYHAASQQGEWYVINADLRHWFHQIPIPHHLRNLFQFKIGDNIYRQKTLAMGSYFSPSIAQTITWAMILDGKPPGINKEKITQMPPWLGFENNTGGIFVLQDNIFIATNSLELATQWSKHLFENAKKFNITFKGDGPKVITIKKNQQDSFTEFNGIDFFFNGWRTAFRHERQDLLGNDNVRLTHIQIAAMLGEILWDYRVRGISPLDREELWELFSINAPKSEAEWDDINTCIQPAHIRILRREIEEVRQHKFRECWRAWQPDGNKTVCYAVDASLERGKNDHGTPVLATLAIVSFPRQVETKKWFWKSMRSKHVYIGEAELEAIVWAVEDAMMPTRGNVVKDLSMIIIATDSLCAKGWVERMYSERPYARFLLRRLRTLLERGAQGPVRLSCVYVLSEHNLADVPSRELVVEGEICGGNEKSEFAKSMLKDVDDVTTRAKATVSLLRQMKSIVLSRAVVRGAIVVKTERAETEKRVKEDGATN